MKKLAFLFLAAIILVGCDQGKQRYTQSSAEIDSFKAAVAAYESGDWEAYKSKFADTAQVFYNSDSNYRSPTEVADYHMETNGSLSSYGFEDDKGDIEMVVTDDGETWVNFWGVWKGTVASTMAEVEIPVHLTAQFVDGKIVKEYGYWDNAPMQKAMAEAASEDVPDESSEEASSAEGAEEGAEETEQ